MPKIPQFSNSYKILARYKAIISTVVSYGFGDILEKTNIHKILFNGANLFSKDSKKLENVGTYCRIRLMLEELGPVFIKFGQILSQRIDILPKELIDELTQLQNNVLEVDRDSIVTMIESELKLPIDELFDDFSYTPLASASIAQVHSAKTKSGDDIVIKVQRPNIVEVINTDTEIMTHLADVLEKRINYFRIIGISKLLRDFKENMNNEVNFHIESSNIKRFSYNFKDSSVIKVPKVYNELSSTKILTMERIFGDKVDEYVPKENGITKSQLAINGFDSIFNQIFDHGFFHGDPHPGNIFVVDNKICFLDFGLMGSVMPSQKKHLVKLLMAFDAKDTKKIISSLVVLTGDPTLPKNRDLEYDIEHLIEKYYWLDMKSINLNSLFEDFNRVVYKYEVNIPPNFFMLFKALISFEGIGRALDEDFNILQEIEKQGKKLFFKSAIPANLLKDLYYNLTDAFSLMKNMPGELISLVEQLKMGQLKIEFEHVGLDKLTSTINNTVNKLISAVILAALIIGSSVIIHSKVPPMFYEIPIIGIITFVIAAMWGFFLLVMMIRNR